MKPTQIQAAPAALIPAALPSDPFTAFLADTVTFCVDARKPLFHLRCEYERMLDADNIKPHGASIGAITDTIMAAGRMLDAGRDLLRTLQATMPTHPAWQRKAGSFQRYRRMLKELGAQPVWRKKADDCMALWIPSASTPAEDFTAAVVYVALAVRDYLIMIRHDHKQRADHHATTPLEESLAALYNIRTVIDMAADDIAYVLAVINAQSSAGEAAA